ncbi:segregation/condensation protein A [Candidatus Woesearchaeota archaeon]|nr:segregation/condensation protein A [Candidatus Woesearchaeota archaeon]
MEQKIIDLIVGKDEVTWQSMLMNLVRSENMDPWNIDISSLTQKYISMLSKLKELDFRVSGKMVLAAAILLRIKTKKLVGEDIVELERLMSPKENEIDEEGFYEDLATDERPPDGGYPQLLPRTPQPRKRKVSIYDLMNALQKALEVRDRRILRKPVINIKMPEKRIDITKVVGSVLERITSLMGSGRKVYYTELLQSQRKEDKIITFISLLYLANHDQRKIDLIQKEAFGEIEIALPQDMMNNHRKPDIIQTQPALTTS